MAKQTTIVVIGSLRVKANGASSWADEAGGYTEYIFCQFWQRRQFVGLPVCYPVHQSPSEKGSIQKGKNLLQQGADSFLLE